MSALLRLARLRVSGLAQKVAILTSQVLGACIRHVCQMAEALRIVADPPLHVAPQVGMCNIWMLTIMSKSDATSMQVWALHTITCSGACVMLLPPTNAKRLPHIEP